MAEKIGLVKVHSEDLSYYELQTSLSENNSGVQFSVCDNEAMRGFTDVEWVTFALMAIPAAESLVNIVLAIKDTIKARISKYLKEINCKRTIKVNVKIKLPFFSYEKEEEIIIKTSEE